MTSLSFGGITTEVFAKIQQKLAGLGIQLPATSTGSISGSGVKAEFNWDGLDKLVISVLEKPMFLPMSAITSGIISAIKDCGGRTE